MASIKLKGDTSGELTIQAPSVAGTNTLNLPASSGTLATTAQASIGMKNRIINGNMTIDQRNAGAAINPAINNAYSIDRWSTNSNVASKYSVQQDAGAVTPPAGFTNYLGATSLSAYTAVSSDSFALVQKIEGYNFADLDFGKATAKTVTLSFWVRSSLTGTFGGSLTNSPIDRSYPFTYTISVANTWEKKSVTIAGDTSGTWLTTNNIGAWLWFGLGMGSTLNGTAGAWAGGNYRSATGATSVVGTNGATFYITGVQLEAGTTATDFENLQYGQQLALCQRYYWRTTGSSYAAIGSGHVASSVEMRICIINPVETRAAGTVSIGGTLRGNTGATTCDITTIYGTWMGKVSSMVQFLSTGLSVNGGAILHHMNNTTNYLQIDAEL